MRFLVDENLPPRVAALLRGLGYDCLYIEGLHMSGMSDESVFEAAQRDGRVIVTRDGGFANTIKFPLATHHGVLYLRTHGLHGEPLAALVTDFVERWSGGMDHMVVTLEPGYVRTRRLIDG